MMGIVYNLWCVALSRAIRNIPRMIKICCCFDFKFVGTFCGNDMINYIAIYKNNDELLERVGEPSYII